MTETNNTAQIEALTKAKAKIAIGWCKGSWARDKNNKKSHPRSQYACSWCLGGALLSVGDPDVVVEVGQARDTVEAIIKKKSDKVVGIIGWNDAAKDQAEVLDLIDEAISSLQAETK